MEAPLGIADAPPGAEACELPSPAALRARLALPPGAQRVVQRARAEVRAAIRGHDPRFLVIVGPCSIHDPRSALEYASRLAGLQPELHGRVLLVMRTYFEKPRSALGWKGFINDPRLDGSCDVAAGLGGARSLLAAIGELGVPCASELLDPVIAPYLVDGLTTGVIGARTAASQPHRELASGLPMPVGFKNPLDGSLGVACDAMLAAGEPHARLGIGPGGRAAVIRTPGAADRFLVLRGGASGPNYGAASLARASALLAPQRIARPLVVDCSHDNSGKDHRRQASVCRSVLATFSSGAPRPLGFMLESHLAEGRQSWRAGAELAYGVSITDGCIGWKETEELLREIAAAV